VGLLIEAGQLTVVAELATAAGVPDVRTGGRPSDYKNPLNELIAMRERDGQALQGRNEEAKALLTEFKTQFPKIKSPSVQTVRRYVSAARRGS